MPLPPTLTPIPKCVRSSLLIIFLAFFCLGMARRPLGPSVIKGKVADSRTNQPLVSAQIKLVSLLGQLKASALTDTNGNYELRNLSFPRYGSFYILKASKEGYVSKSIIHFFKNGKTYTFNFGLKPNWPPSVGTIVPSSGTSPPNQAVIFTATYSDLDGWQDIQNAHLLINISVNGKNCFYGYYNQNANKLYLRKDDNSSWMGGFAPGSSNVIQNSYAKLDCSKTTVSGLDTTLTVKWSVTFKSSFTGTKNMYLKVVDDAGAYNGWIQKGTWTIRQNQPPVINSITPTDYSTFLAGARINIQINASDPNNDPLEYQFSIGGTIKQPWSSSNTYAWQTSAADTGTVSITCQVRDNKGAVASRTITCHIINPTVEEILKKVADNYTLVNDKQMDVTVTSKFNNETFGSTIYTRHYFEKPDKQRTDTFSCPDRADSSKTEIHIALGPDIYLIDPVSHAQSQRNILSELNLTPEQLNQIDEIYHLQDFLSAHTIIRKDTPEDLAKGLVMLEATPKVAHNVYSKLGIQIDYFEGLRTKSITYFKENSQDKLKQGIEITNSQAMPNGAWVPKAQVKTLYLTDGNLVMTSNFTNIQINTGLPDYLFDPTKQ